ncbi:hypothetical protein JAAARDRAFT_43178 [Jaapia argillacea MUCL 33604]|uniref:Uncharacterized protein n=1 Tax=Jaapia argillacea MUCL 33604 TaxID=933084 RepID=A0A067P270_9AGAM|nr:hypothetical protein JAAARDRAFT_43178 [Jaapia argillacea MUCL 33604]
MSGMTSTDGGFEWLSVSRRATGSEGHKRDCGDHEGQSIRQRVPHEQAVDLIRWESTKGLSELESQAHPAPQARRVVVLERTSYPRDTSNTVGVRRTPTM